MISKNHIKEFLSQKYPNVKDLSYVRLELPLNQLMKTESAVDKSFERFSQRDFIDLFERNNWTALNTYLSNKSLIKEFAEWYFENIIGIDNIPFGYPKVSAIEHIELEDVSSDVRYQKEYFKDYDSFVDCLEEHFGSITDDKYVMHKIFFVLMWEGIDRHESRRLKDSDIEFDVTNKIVTMHLSDRDVKIMEERSFEIIRKFNNSGYDFEQKNGRQRSYEYADTSMVLRNTSKKPVTRYQEISESSINNYFTDQMKLANLLPESNEYFGKKLVFRGISDSGAFYRLIQWNKHDHICKDDIIKARQTINISGSIVSSFNFNYQGWKKYFGYK